MEAIWVESSTYFSCLPLFPDIGQGIGGLRQAPLNFTIKSSPPSHVPAPKPPGRLLSEAFALEYERIMDLPLRQEPTKFKAQPLTFIACVRCVRIVAPIEKTLKKRHMSCVMCHLPPVTCHMPLTPTATAPDPPPSNSPTMHSRMVHKHPKKNCASYFRPFQSQFSTNRPTGPIRSSSPDVCVMMSPPHVIFKRGPSPHFCVDQVRSCVEP